MTQKRSLQSRFGLARAYFATCFTASAMSVSAATLVYNFTGDSIQPGTGGSSTGAKSSAVTSNSFGAGVTVSDFNLNAEARETAIINTHGFVAEGSGGNGMHGFQTFNNGGSTFSFTITVDATHELNLTSLDFLYGVFDDAAGSQSGDASYTLSSNLGGISTNASNSLTMNSGSLVSSDYSATLGAALSGLRNTSVTFSWTFDTVNNYNSGNPDRGHVMDNIVLTGTVTPVPEPSVVVLAGLGGLVLIRRRR